MLDVLWGLGDNRYLLLPCKNGATSDTISKSYTDEVSGDLTWFRSQYDGTSRPIIAIVHPSFHLANIATAPPEMRVIGVPQLSGLRDAVRGFATAVKDRRTDPEHIRRALSAQGLLASQIADRYTVSPKRLPGHS
jgi:hypothetical protein